MVEKARQYMGANADATFGDLGRETGLKRTRVQRILKEDLEHKPLRTVAGQHEEEEANRE